METKAENRPCDTLCSAKKTCSLVPTYHHPGHCLKRKSRLAGGLRGAVWLEWSGDGGMVMRLGLFLFLREVRRHRPFDVPPMYEFAKCHQSRKRGEKNVDAELTALQEEYGAWLEAFLLSLRDSTIMEALHAVRRSSGRARSHRVTAGIWKRRIRNPKSFRKCRKISDTRPESTKSRIWYTTGRMKISAQAWEVFSELLVNFAGVILLAIPGYFIAQDWFRLTTCIILCILITRIGIQFRKNQYDQSE
jgi:hypothetical protein